MYAALRWPLALAVAAASFSTLPGRAQSVTGVGIGATPDASAALDISSPSKGVLFPRIGLTGRSDAGTVASPATGLVLYNTAATVGGTPQLVVNAGTPAAPAWSPLGSNNWGLAGNGNTSGNFLGTTDNQPLVVKVNNAEVSRFLPGGAVWLGTTSQFIGYQAGNSNTSTYPNQFIGYQAGYNNTTGNYNLLVGYQAGYSNVNGGANHYVGYQAGYGTTSGYGNTALGYRALYAATSSTYNTALGYQAGYNTSTAGNMVALGYQAGYNNNAANNTFVGYSAGYNTSSGDGNTFVGAGAGSANTRGWSNTYLGAYTGMYSTASNNVFIGYMVAQANTTGNLNTFIGDQAGTSNTTGSQNTFIGLTAGTSNTTGRQNLVLGYQGGQNLTTGTGNLFLGYQAGLTSAAAQHSYATAIGYGATVDADNAIVLGTSASKVGIGVTAPTEALQVAGNILASGTITQNSDRRLKTNIRPLTGALAAVGRLRGVRYEFVPGRGPQGEQIGLIAQELEKVYPELVRTDEMTGLKSVNYAQLTPVLLEAIKALQGQLDELSSRTRQLELTQAAGSFEVQSLRLRLDAAQPAVLLAH